MTLKLIENKKNVRNVVQLVYNERVKESMTLALSDRGLLPNQRQALVMGRGRSIPPLMQGEVNTLLLGEVPQWPSG